MQKVEPRGVLGVLTQARLVEVGRALGFVIPASLTKEKQLNRLLSRPSFSMVEAMRAMTRQELRLACERHGLELAGRARLDLVRRLVEAMPPELRGSLEALEEEEELEDGLPRPGAIALVRQRQYLIEEVRSVGQDDEVMTLVSMACLDDDAAGRPLEVLWELELGARVLSERQQGLGRPDQVDPAERFSAYYQAIKWNCVTATDPELFQSPFRAGIQVWNHQLTPLLKALRLPRANLFIADDVGLGKTIEAGLVLQELTLRQRVDFTLIVCPASVALQWQEEMRERFGLHFEVFHRGFVTQRRRERGFGVNPWSTHNRLIVSYHTVKRPQWRDPLIQFLGPRVRKSLLILDEAHTAAPASASRYAVDSQITRVIRDIAPRFENRLFLSATPHNGHSNSFSALLELLDPQRFMRGVKVEGFEDLEPVMVRRLKGDLRNLTTAQAFPRRRVVEWTLQQEGGRWLLGDEERQEVDLGQDESRELKLAQMLARYTALRSPESGRGKLVFINLQKRLLSCIEAFYCTLRAHALRQLQEPEQPEEASNLELLGASDQAREQEAAWEVIQGSAALEAPQADASALLEEMLLLAEDGRGVPDAKVKALLDWVRRHQCSGAGVPARKRQEGDGQWKDRRLIIFTEYGDTRRYLRNMLHAAISGTDRDTERIMEFGGGMSEDKRAELRHAFNAPFQDHPVRILIATDAAREGVNLQSHCWDLVHYDIPWNPSRMEQRNGRIDRALQPKPEVNCMYFSYPQRPEDRVLRTLVRKIDRIQDELGSLGAVLMDQMGQTLEAQGIHERTLEQLEAAEVKRDAQQAAVAELEAARLRDAALQSDLESASRVLHKSRQVMDFSPDMLREVVEVALEQMGVEPLAPTQVKLGRDASVDAFTLPTLPEGWKRALHSLRPPRGRDEPPWEWERRPPRPVVFSPPPVLTDAVVHLHLEHPLIKRLLSRFQSQGFVGKELGRVTVLMDDKIGQPQVLALGRLSIFGPGASRLHDEIIHIATGWSQEAGPGHLAPLEARQEGALLERLPGLLRHNHSLSVPPKVEQAVLASAPRDFPELWRQVRQESQERELEATDRLRKRGQEEAEQLRQILHRQKNHIQREISQTSLLDLLMEQATQAEIKQREHDIAHMRNRFQDLEREIQDEPGQLEALYQVALARLVPVGLIYLWPSTL